MDHGYQPNKIPGGNKNLLSTVMDKTTTMMKAKKRIFSMVDSTGLPGRLYVEELCWKAIRTMYSQNVVSDPPLVSIYFSKIWKE